MSFGMLSLKRLAVLLVEVVEAMLLLARLLVTAGYLVGVRLDERK